ncbi:MAG: 4-alpha-glucanotransferase [Candidatus Aminicenantes bacterium]
MKRRASGILAHITSLPSRFGIGDLGPSAYRFADFLFRSGQSYWQILPLNPTDSAYDDSPYHSLSAMASNPLLISPEFLVRDGWLKEEDIGEVPDFCGERVDFPAVSEYKSQLYDAAYRRFQKTSPPGDYRVFCRENEDWLHDFALFMVLKDSFSSQTWSRWPAEYRDRDEGVLDQFCCEEQSRVGKEKFLQYVFNRQWNEFKQYCLQKNIHIIGDLPIYVDYDSADVWSHPRFFKLDGEKRPRAVSGVPPDYFSQTGQLWGNPLYDWEEIQRSGFRWWTGRLDRALHLCDIVRIDHFRGLVAYWEVPAEADTAVKGKWVKAPWMDFFKILSKRYIHLPFIAEDLGTITLDVREAMRHFGFPGMKVLLFAFGNDDPSHPYLPHNYEKNDVVYTGTHDNNTTRGWFENEADPAEKSRVHRYLGRPVESGNIHWEFIRLAASSVAATAIIPVQDILGLGETARMNRPSTSRGNWKWRMTFSQLEEAEETPLKELTQMYGRL